MLRPFRERIPDGASEDQSQHCHSIVHTPMYRYSRFHHISSPWWVESGRGKTKDGGWGADSNGLV